MERTLCLSFFVLCAAPAVAQLTVTGTEPGLNAGNVARDVDVVLHFDRAVPVDSVTDDVHVFGKGTGPSAGVWTLENGGTSARFVPNEPFAAGEVVQVTLSNQVTAGDGTQLRGAGYSFEFRVRTRPSSLTFALLDTISVRSSPAVGTRVYGGQACDLDDDGWLDLAIVNQDSSDVRVLLNQADGTGLYDDFLTPTNATGSTPSPNEMADMNGDGLVDHVTGNKFGDSVSILMGNGDGTFAPSANYSMGDLPRGLALLDMDGDGDTDVACANANSSHLSLRFNDGTGVLGPETTMEGGGSGEWGLAAGDMNNDGILDLVVGARTSQRVIVWLSNGDGTFAQSESIDGVDGVWMIVLGDVNGDGDLDVSTGNGTSNSGTILFGDGAGGLTMGQITPAPSFVVATDLGDLDGDGDLDWMLSSFSGGSWTLYENDGAGNFTLQQTFFATSNAACAVMLDIDGDLDMDLALLDEIADEVVLYENVCSTENYCQTSANSAGPGAVLTSTGSASAFANDLVLYAGPVPDSVGLFYYGSAPTFSPFGNGFRCVGGMVFRLSILAASGGTASLALDLTTPPQPAGLIQAGSLWHFQYWFRDPAAGGAAFNLSDGFAVTFCP